MAAIRLLLIEDNPADARLVVEMFLELGADRFELQHTDRIDDLLAADDAPMYEIKRNKQKLMKPTLIRNRSTALVVEHTIALTHRTDPSPSYPHGRHR